MLKRKLRIAALAATALAGLSAPASATTMIQLNFEELIADSTNIVVGEVASSRVEQTAEGVYTVTRFNVTEEVLGASGGVVEVRTAGGAYKPGKFRVSEHAAGIPRYLAGSKAFLFLQADGGAYQITGVAQGSIPVFTTARGDSVRLPESDRVETVAEASERIKKEIERKHPERRGGPVDDQ